MITQIKNNDGVSLLKIEGDMTIYAAAELKHELMNLIGVPGEYEIDLSGVVEIDTSGLQLLVLAKREAARLENRLHFNRQSPAVLEVISLCNMAEYFAE